MYPVDVNNKTVSSNNTSCQYEQVTVNPRKHFVNTNNKFSLIECRESFLPLQVGEMRPKDPEIHSKNAINTESCRYSNRTNGTTKSS